MKRLRISVVSAAALLVIACSNPEADWTKAQTQHTEAAYQAFLERHPDSEWASKAQAELDVIRDRHDWEKARTVDAIEAYNNYLLAHPVGAYLGEARQRIHELEIEEAWAAAQSAGSRVALEDFIIRYADTAQAAEARTALSKLVPRGAAAPAPRAVVKAGTVKPATTVAAPTASPAVKNPVTGKSALAHIAPAAGQAKKPAAKLPAGDYRIQFGAFSTAAKANSEKARIEKRFGSTLGALTVKPAATSGDLHRLQSAAMTADAARTTCRELKGSGQDCLVVRR